MISETLQKYLDKWTRVETRKNGTQDLCEKVLEEFSKTHVIAYRRSNSGFVKGFRIGAAGWPDFDMMMDGKYHAIECKGYSGKNLATETPLNSNQIQTLNLLRAAGAILWIVSDPGTLWAALHSDTMARSLHDDSCAKLVSQTAKSVSRLDAKKDSQLEPKPSVLTLACK